MAASLSDVRTGCAVEAIEQGAGGDGVSVRVGPRTERASAVVVAVPVAIAARISFTPSLPSKVATGLAELPMGVASKFAVATVSSPPVRSRQATDLSMWCWAANGPDGSPRRCIASFAGSPQAQHELGVDRGEVEPWFRRIATMNPDVEFEGEPVLYAWGDDPYALGSYSAWDTRSLGRADVFSQPVDRMVFAGEHTAGPGNQGTMNGALISGRRAAEQVASIVR